MSNSKENIHSKFLIMGTGTYAVVAFTVPSVLDKDIKLI